MSGKRVTVVGAGGNIGSHLVSHLARMPGLERVTLVDRDRYELGNLAGQDIEPRDVGGAKALVQARRLRRINPLLRVEAVVAAVEDVPLGRLRADVILACLDSLRARQYVNEAAWRLGAPWIDAGVRGDGLLARMNAYVPGDAAGPCLECAWSEADYAALEQVYPCRGAEAPAPSRSPSALGALAASLQALECQELLGGKAEAVAAGRQVTIDARWHKHYVTTIRRNPKCRFDHENWRVEALECHPGRFTVREALDLGGEIRVDGTPFVRRLVCMGCGYRRRVGLRLLRPRAPGCPECGRTLVAPGSDRLVRLDASLPARWLSRSLASLGLRAGDVFGGGDRYFEIVTEEG